MTGKGFPCTDCGRLYASARTLENHKSKGCKKPVEESQSVTLESKPTVNQSGNQNGKPTVNSESKPTGNQNGKPESKPTVTPVGKQNDENKSERISISKLIGESEPSSLEEKIRLLQLELKEKDKLYAEMKEEKERAYDEMKAVLIMQIIFLKEKVKEVTEKFCEYAIENVKKPHHTVNVVSNNYMPEEFHLQKDMAYLPASLDLGKLVNEVVPAIQEKALQEKQNATRQTTTSRQSTTRSLSDSDDEHTSSNSASDDPFDVFETNPFFKTKGNGTTTTTTKTTIVHPPPPRTTFKD